MEKGYDPVPPVDENVFEMTAADRKKRNIGALPGDLNEAIKAAEGGELLRKVFGDALLEKFIKNKKLEWERYRAHVSDYELNNYLPIL